MRTIELDEIRRRLIYGDVIAKMREALVAQSRGECDTPMPMHLDISPEQAEIHIKSSYRRGGKYFVLKVASTFPRNVDRGLPTGNGMMLLSSAETGEPVALLADAGHLTDVRTAAVSAMVARELGRTDRVLGVLGTGIQARLQVRMHAEVLNIEKVLIWGRSRDRAEECRSELREAGFDVAVMASPRELARDARLIVTATASHQPLLFAADIQPGTHIAAVGSDSPGKQELDPSILESADLLLVDSSTQCRKLGELQHAPNAWDRAIEIGAFCESPRAVDRDGITVCDCTGLGVEDLYIAEQVFENQCL